MTRKTRFATLSIWLFLNGGNMALPQSTAAQSPALAGAEWHVEDIAGRGMVDNSRVTLRFSTDGRLAGSASCNRYMATYSTRGRTLVIGPPATTRMACPPALMQQERRFLTMLATVTRFEIDQTGALVLHAADASRILARR
jgi:heat shock protein HslJ